MLSPSGKIFGIPSSSASVLIVDPLKMEADTTTMPSQDCQLAAASGLEVCCLRLARSLAFLGLLPALCY